MRSKQNPSEGRIDRRMTALGVIGFLALAGSFFLLGLFCIGPIVRSHMPSRTRIPQTVYNPPAHRQPEEKPAEVEQAPQQPLDVQITEQGVDQTPPAGDQSQSGNDQVNQDDNSLTITLQPEGRNSQPAAGPETEKPRKQSIHRETTTEKPRVATETVSRVYRVQAGRFASMANAQTLADDLKGRGYHAEIKAVPSQDRTLYRVQLGEYKHEADARRLADDLSAGGYTPTVITEQPEQ